MFCSLLGTSRKSRCTDFWGNSLKNRSLQTLTVYAIVVISNSRQPPERRMGRFLTSAWEFLAGDMGCRTYTPEVVIFQTIEMDVTPFGCLLKGKSTGLPTATP